MNGVSAAPPAVLATFEPVRVVLLVLGGRVIASLAISTRQRDNGAHVVYLPVMRKNFSTGLTICQRTGIEAKNRERRPPLANIRLHSA